MDSNYLIKSIREADNFSASFNNIDKIIFKEQHILDIMILLYQCLNKNTRDNFYISIDTSLNEDQEINVDNFTCYLIDNVVKVKKIKSNICFHNRIIQAFNYNNYDFYYFDNLIFLYRENKVEQVEIYSVLKFHKGKYLKVDMNSFYLEDIQDFYNTQDIEFLKDGYDYKIIKNKFNMDIKS